MRLDVLAATCLISHFFRTCPADALASQVSDARAHEPGRKRADAASGHLSKFSHLPFGQEEVQLREFVSTLHVKPLSGRGNLAADSLMSILSLAPPLPNSKVALASTERFAPSCMPRNRLRAMSQHCLRGKGVHDGCSGGTLLYGFIFRSTFRASMFITVATKTMFFHLSPPKSSWVLPGPPGPIRVPPGLMILYMFHPPVEGSAK